MLLNEGFPSSNDDASDQTQKDRFPGNDRVSDGVIDSVKRDGVFPSLSF